MAPNEISIAIDNNEHDSIHQAIEQLLSDQNSRNKIEAWQSLLAQLRELRGTTDEHTGTFVLKSLAGHNLQCKGKRGKYNKVNRPVIDYLKAHFRWPENELNYRQKVNDDRLSDVIFGCNENSSRKAKAEQDQKATEQKLEQNMKKNWDSISPSLVICGGLGTYIAYRLIKGLILAYFIGS